VWTRRLRLPEANRSKGAGVQAVHFKEVAKMPIRFTPAADIQVMTVQVCAGATGGQVAAFVEDQVARQPAVAGWDWIFDLVQASGETGIEDTNRIARAMNSAELDWAALTPVTVFVTRDPAFPLWTRAMDPLFYTRTHRVAASLAEAKSVILSHRSR